MVNEIRSLRGDYWFLSNFYPCTVKRDGLVYKSLEAAFQAAKCADPADRIRFQRLSPSEAKKLGRTVILRSDWERVKLSILTELIRLKFVSHPDLLLSLLGTGDAMIFEDNTWHDNYYGNCTCERCRDISGLNYHGAMLMQLREQIKHLICCFNAGLGDESEESI